MDVQSDNPEAFTTRDYFYDTRAEPLLLRPMSPRRAMRQRKVLQRRHQHTFDAATQRCACGFLRSWASDGLTWHSPGAWSFASGRMPLRPHGGRGVTERSKVIRAQRTDRRWDWLEDVQAAWLAKWGPWFDGPESLGLGPRER